jgi:hypothetical protein
MARGVFRAYPMYIGGKKVAEIHSGDNDVNNNDELVIGTDGVLGHADGATVTRITANAVIPVAGTEIDLDSIRKNRQYVQVDLAVNGKAQMCDMRLIAAKYSWDFKNGRADGSFTFEGGEPDYA